MNRILLFLILTFVCVLSNRLKTKDACSTEQMSACNSFCASNGKKVCDCSHGLLHLGHQKCKCSKAVVGCWF